MKDLRILLFSFFIFSLPIISHAQLADISEGCAPLTVNFTAPSGAGTFFWDFGNNATSTNENPSRTYTDPGVYVVQFRLLQGEPVIASDTIRVYAKPDITITADPRQGCIPLSVNFESTTDIDAGIDVTGYVWTFGDSRIGTGATTNHTYQATGSFEVSLQITSSTPGCTTTGLFNDYIQTSQAPTVSFITSPFPPVACEAPLTVSLINNTVSVQDSIHYEWDFGNGNTSNLQNPPPQTYTTTGQFPIVLTATDTLGCTASATIGVSVGSPVANFEIPDTVCSGEAITITNRSTNGRYFWEFGPGDDPPTSNSRFPTVTFWNEGPRDVTLTVTSPDGQCESDTTIAIFVEDVDASFEVDPTYSCSDSTVFSFTRNSTEGDSVIWQFSDGSISNVQNPTYLWANPDTSIYGINGVNFDIVSLTVLKDVGSKTCRFFFSRVDTIHLPNALFRPDTIMGCAPLTVEFEDLSTSNEDIASWTYLWGDGTSQTFTDDGDVSHVFNTPGEYPVRLIIENTAGCRDTSYAITIEVGGPLNPDFTVDKTTVCPGDTVQFTDLTNDTLVDAWHYTSDSHRLFHCADEPNPIWVFSSETGVMDVTLTVLYNGCPSTITKSDLIDVNGPLAKIAYELTDCTTPFVFAFKDSSYEATSVKWFFGDGDSSTVRNPTHEYKITGDYQVVMVAENAGSGCPPSFDTATVYVRDIKADFDLAATYCSGDMFDLNASMSRDVNATCWKGYTWFSSENRPITTQDSIIQFMFGEPGQQWVRLVVEDINGCRDAISDTTMIFRPEALFSMDKDRICIPSTVNFADMSSGNGNIVSWEWDFGDGNMSTEQNPTHTYTTLPPNGNEFIVTLIVKDENNCPAEFTLPISVYEPVSQITASDLELCEGDEITFSASDFTQEGSFLNFSWSLDGTVFSTQQSDMLDFPNAGNFELKLNFEEDATGCRGETSEIVRVQAYPDAEFTSPFDDADRVCANTQIIFTADQSQTNVRFDYIVDNTTIRTDDPGGQFGFAFPEGTQTVTMVAKTTFGCTDTFSRAYTFVEPKGVLTADPTEICRGESVTFTVSDTSNISSFTLDYGDGAVANDAFNSTHTYTGFGTDGGYNAILTLRLDIQGGQTCTETREERIDVIQTIADFETADTPCFGLPVEFENRSTQADIFRWNFGNGTNSNEENPQVNYDMPGTYNVTLIVENAALGCADTITKSIAVNQGLNISIDAASENICAGDSTLLAINGLPPDWTSIIWSPTGFVTESNDVEVTQTVITQTQTISVEVVDGVGCVGTAEITINVLSNPGIEGDSISILVGAESENVSLPPLPAALEGFEVTWTPQTNLNIDDPLNPIMTKAPENSITYFAFVTDVGDCFNIEFIRNVQVYRIPNVFTPDGDGTNDFFNLATEGPISGSEIINFAIYNRWGTKVYENDNPAQGWDGKYNNEPQPSDVYVYIIEVELTDGTRETITGDVTLLR